MAVMVRTGPAEFEHSAAVVAQQVSSHIDSKVTRIQMSTFEFCAQTCYRVWRWIFIF
jgi:hypothetical protein